MEFRVLGPLEVSAGGRRLALGGPRQRLVLALLLARANQVVSTDRLIDEVWDGQPPEAARNALQSYVSRLRQIFGDGVAIEGRAPGYALVVEPDRIDAHRFEALRRTGHDLLVDDPEAGVALLEDALGLWRGAPFADLDDRLALGSEIGRLEELRLSAVEDRIEARLALGRTDELTAELESLVEQHPLRERLWGHLMLALYRSGRQADALDAYQRARRWLADELGLDPSPELRSLQGRILRQDPVLEPAASRLRGYRLLEQIGAGGFGVVHRATQPHVGRDVAVKVINPTLADDPRFIRRFEAEAQLIARLEHPRIVPLHDYWREPGGAYLVMRLLRGGSLKQALERGPLGAERVVEVVGQVAGGLAAAHRQGVVHRDVKPSNILLDEDGNAYLSDFGLATDVVAQTTSPTPDTIAYVSPEQSRGEPCTRQTDVYSLGVVLREALGGGEVSPALAEVVARATAENPADRHADAEALLAALSRTLGRAPTVAPIAERNPYKGLLAFDEADAADFFGREALADRLVARLRDGARFLALVGASGSGKSSAVRAALFPALRRDAVRGSSDWFLVDMSPGAQPLEELESAVRRIAVDAPSELTGRRDSELLLFVDQLEELFASAGDDERRTRFLDQLAMAATDSEERVRLVVAMRADSFDRALAHPGLATLLRSGVETVVPLTPEELERAVVCPAERGGVAVEPGLVPEIVADVSGRPGALPLLQYALAELFDRRRERTLTFADYREVGGIAGSVARRAEELYAGAGDAGRAATGQLFLRLVAVDEAEVQARPRVPRSELASLEVDPQALDDVIEAFGRHRLLSFDRDPRTREPTVELAHEALLDAWGRLRGWIDEARDDVRTRTRLGAAASEWAASGRDTDFLLVGTRLELFEAWASTARLALARAEREYLDASRARRSAERAEEAARQARERALELRSRNRLRALAAMLAAAAIVAAVVSVFAFDQREAAETHAGRAERQAHLATARELASAARANLDDDPERSILLALAAVETTRAEDGSALREAEEALHTAVQSSRVVLSVPGTVGSDGWTALAFSPDGSRLATIADHGEAAVWDAASGAKLVSAGPRTSSATSVAYAPDGRIATGDETGATALWNEGTVSKRFPAHRGRVAAMAFSRDGTRIATAGSDGSIDVRNTRSGRGIARVVDAGEGPALAMSPDGTRLAAADGTSAAVWSVTTGRLLRRLRASAFDVAFSPDGSRLAVVGLSGLVELWSADLGRRLGTANGHEGTHVRGVEFSRDGRRLATAGDDGTVQVWDARTMRPLLALPGGGDAVDLVAFSPDGTRVAGCCGGGRATVWNVTPVGSRELLAIPGHAGLVLNVSFSPDGRRLATAGQDGTAKLWDARSGRKLLAFRGHAGPVADIVFSPDGRRLATAGFDRTARLWDGGSGEELRVLRGHRAPVWGASFSDGDTVATASEDTTARIWAADTGRLLGELRGHGRAVYDVAYSRDGSRIATAGDDRTARIWNADSGRLLRTLRGHAGNIVQVAFSPDGRRLATAGFDGGRVWDVATGRQLFALTGHGAIVLDVDFSPDGRRIATASPDGTARLWSARAGDELLRLDVPGGRAERLAFSPDGVRLAVAGHGAVQLYALRIDDLVTLARTRLTRRLTDDECRQYLHQDRCAA